MSDMRDGWRKAASCARVVALGPVFQTAWLVKADLGTSYAKLICADCPVRIACLVNAVNDPYAQGIRGGFYFDLGTVDRSDAKVIKELTGLDAVVTQRGNFRRIAALEEFGNGG